MSDDIRPTNQLIYAVDIYDVSHCLLVDSTGALKVTATGATQGNWSYYSGTFGTVTVSSGQRVIGIGCHSTNGGSIVINSGSTVPVPAGVGIGIEPNGNLVAPTIVFTGTDSYFVEVVS